MDTLLINAQQNSLKPAKATQSNRPVRVNCCVCEKLIAEETKTKKGQDAIHCEGVCKSWMHRKCIGLSLKSHEALGDPNKPYYCPQCMLERQGNEIVSLKNEVTSLTKALSDMKITLALVQSQQKDLVSAPTIINDQPTTNGHPLNYSAATRQKLPHALPNQAKVSKKVNEYDRKFNVVIYGLNESAEGTPRYLRSLNDLQLVKHTLESVDENLSEQAIRDCLRLGRYDAHKHRPILVKLSRSCDTSSILSKRKNLASQPGVQIRPDLSRSDRASLSTLLKERWKLISSGREKSSIRIRGNIIYVDGEKYGQAEDSTFVAAKTSSPSPTGSLLGFHDRSLSPHTSPTTLHRLPEATAPTNPGSQT